MDWKTMLSSSCPKTQTIAACSRYHEHWIDNQRIDCRSFKFAHLMNARSN